MPTFNVSNTKPTFHRNRLHKTSDIPSEGGAKTWAILASLINTAKLQDIDPWHYLTVVLERIGSGRTKINQLHMLLPWNWKVERDSSQAKLAA
jgi:hypothetical protein